MWVTNGFWTNFFHPDYLDPEYGETSAEQHITPIQRYRINIKYNTNKTIRICSCLMQYLYFYTVRVWGILIGGFIPSELLDCGDWETVSDVSKNGREFGAFETSTTLRHLTRRISQKTSVTSVWALYISRMLCGCCAFKNGTAVENKRKNFTNPVSSCVLTDGNPVYTVT